ncbi:MAG TPA: DEAD/DEAH box helicase [Alphaproteobacteria bacterium]|nr:DEAD/DEAH box helicase [Alphaproteobacteria bacterium]
MTFNAYGLGKDLISRLEVMGITSPTPIQAATLPYALQGRDIMALAQTGSGKTGSFLWPLLDIMSQKRPKARLTRVIILEPTRELAAQVRENFVKTNPFPYLRSCLLVGGEFMGDQEKLLKKGADFIIATPGRLIDLLNRGRLLLSGVQHLVIDEADRMLDMGFIPDIERLASQLPTLRQTLLFSATMEKEIQALGHSYMINPKSLETSKANSTAETIEQLYVVVGEGDKHSAVRSLLKEYNPTQGLIFCNRKKDIDVLVTSLKKDGFESVMGLHGDLSQSLRNETLASFKAQELKFLVASDVAARGLDVEGLPLVINADLPIQKEDYVHRIGRTGRAGLSGMAITLIEKKQLKKLKILENFIKKPLVQKELKVEPKKIILEPKKINIVLQRFDEELKDYKGPGFGFWVPAFIKREVLLPDHGTNAPA